MARLGLGKDPRTGKYRVWQQTSTDYDVVARALATAVEHRRQGQRVGAERQTLGDYLDDWVESAIKGKPASTYSSYLQLVATHCEHLSVHRETVIYRYTISPVRVAAVEDAEDEDGLGVVGEGEEDAPVADA